MKIAKQVISVEQKHLSNQASNKIYEYGTKWPITFNAEKTSLKTFTGRLPPLLPHLLCDNEIPVENSHKHLGLTLPVI